MHVLVLPEVVVANMHGALKFDYGQLTVLKTSHANYCLSHVCELYVSNVMLWSSVGLPGSALLSIPGDLWPRPASLRDSISRRRRLFIPCPSSWTLHSGLEELCMQHMFL